MHSTAVLQDWCVLPPSQSPLRGASVASVVVISATPSQKTLLVVVLSGGPASSVAFHKVELDESPHGEVANVKSSHSVNLKPELDGAVISAVAVADEALDPFVLLGTSRGVVLVCSADGTIIACVSFNFGVPILKLMLNVVTPHLINNPSTLRSSGAHGRNVVDSICIIHSDGKVLVLPQEILKSITQSVTRHRSTAPRPILSLPPEAMHSSTPILHAAGECAWAYAISALVQLGDSPRFAESVRDVACCFRVCPDPLDVLLPNARLDYSFVVVGRDPCASGYVVRHENVAVTASQVVAEAASRAVHYFKQWWWGSKVPPNAATSLQPGNGEHGGADTNKMRPPLTIKSAPCVFSLLRSGSQFGGEWRSLTIDPTQRFAACTDVSHGRVWLLDLISGLVIRVWKGARGAECGWILHEGAEDSRTVLVLVVHLTLRNIVEFYAMSHRCERLSACRVPKGARILALASGPSMRSRCLMWDEARNSIFDVRLHALTHVGAKVTVLADQEAGVDFRSADDPMFTDMLSKLKVSMWGDGGKELAEALVAMCELPHQCVQVALAMPMPTDVSSFTTMVDVLDGLIAHIKARFAPNPSDDCTVDFRHGALNSTAIRQWSAAQALNFCTLRKTLITTFATLTNMVEQLDGRSGAVMAATPIASITTSMFSMMVGGKDAGSEVAHPWFSLVHNNQHLLSTDAFKHLLQLMESGPTEEFASGSAPEPCDLKEFLEMFWCGGHRVKLRQGALSRTATSRLAQVIFGTTGPIALVTHAKHLLSLGFETSFCVELFVLYLVETFGCTASFVRGNELKMVSRVVARISASDLHQIASCSGALSPTRKLGILALVLLARVDDGLRAQRVTPGSSDASGSTIVMPLSSAAASMLTRDVERYVLLDKVFSSVPHLDDTTMFSISMGEVVAQTPFLLIRNMMLSASRPTEDNKKEAWKTECAASLYVTDFRRRLVTLVHDGCHVVLPGRHKTDVDMISHLEVVVAELQAIGADIAGPAGVNDEAALTGLRATHKNLERKDLICDVVLLASVALDLAVQFLAPLREVLSCCSKSRKPFDMELLKQELRARVECNVTSRGALSFLHCCANTVEFLLDTISAYLVGGHLWQLSGSAEESFYELTEEIVSNDDERPFPSTSSRLRVALQRLILMVDGVDFASFESYVSCTSDVLRLCIALGASEPMAVSFFCPCDEWQSLFLSLDMLQSRCEPLAQQKDEAQDRKRHQEVFNFIVGPYLAASPSCRSNVLTNVKRTLDATIADTLGTSTTDLVPLCYFAVAIVSDDVEWAERLLTMIHSRAKAGLLLQGELKRRASIFLKIVRSLRDGAGGDKVKLALASRRQMAVEALVTPLLRSWMDDSLVSEKDQNVPPFDASRLHDLSAVQLKMQHGERRSAVQRTRALCFLLEHCGDGTSNICPMADVAGQLEALCIELERQFE